MDKTYVLLNCHSEHSVKESPVRIGELCKRASEIGCRTIALADHNSCTGWVEFLNACEEYNLNGIPGIEADLRLNDGTMVKINLYAKNHEGYKSLSYAVTRSWGVVKEGLSDTPVMTEDILFALHDIVVLSGDIFMSILLQNEKLKEKSEALREKMRVLSNPDDPAYLKNVELLREADEKLAEKTAKKTILEREANKKFARKEKNLEILKKEGENGEKKYKEALKELEEEKKRSAKAKVELEALKKEIKSDRKLKNLIAGRIREDEKDHPQYLKLAEELEKIAPKTKRETRKYMTSLMRKMRDVFGDDFYVEVKNHKTKEEKELIPVIASLAEKEGINLVAVNSPYLLDKGQKNSMQIMRSIDEGYWVPLTDADDEYCIKSDKELFGDLCEILDKNTADQAMRNTRVVAQKCSIKLLKENHYPRYRDENGIIPKDSAKELRRIAEENIKVKFPDGGFTKEYRDRLEYELSVITSLGFCDYLLIVMDFIKFAEKEAKKNPQQTGYGVGPGRGSGAGCLVNYLIGITKLDPIEHGLLFERFLNKDRVTMPDIDTDFSKEIRDRVVRYVEEKYGEDSVSIIRTALTQGAKGSVRNCARATGYEKQGSKKSEEIRLKYLKIGDDIAKQVPTGQKITLKDADFSCFKDNEEYMEVIDRSFMTESLITSIGIHAAGVVIGDGNRLSDYIPLMYFTSKNKWGVQCDKEETEQIGLLKMDFLGLINLDIISECIRGVKDHYGIKIDPSSIPQEKEIYANIFANGNTDCVFQFESEGMKKMLKSFKPEKFSDIVLAVAAYRPGPMESIPDIIAVKQGKKKPDYELPLLKNILDDTYGCTVYQEQLMEIFHSCAGFSLGEADIIRRYMSKKKVEKFLSYKDRFISGCVNNGATGKGAEQLWEKLTGFALYAFNKSHAAAYAFVSYQTAWLKYHYPQEYMCAVLNSKINKTDQIRRVLGACRKMDIKLLLPDINISGEKFSTDGRNGIRFGLSSIKGIKKTAAQIITERNENGSFQDLNDFLLRAGAGTGNTSSLIRGGAFDAYEGRSRKELISSLDERVLSVKKIKKAQENAEKYRVKAKEAIDEKEKGRLRRQAKKSLEAAENAKAKLLSVKGESFKYDKNEELEDEKEILGAYVSGHPMDAYSSVYRRVKRICDFETGKGSYAGIITDLRIAKRKKDGADMAFFTLDEPTGTVQIDCFVKVYEEYKELIEEGAAVIVAGDGKVSGSEEENGDEAEDEKYELIAKKIEICTKDLPFLFISTDDVKILEDYKDPLGYPAYIHDPATGKVHLYEERLNFDILEEKRIFVKWLNKDLPKRTPTGREISKEELKQMCIISD